MLKTVPWNENELIEGKYPYRAKEGKIKQIYLPGGVVLDVKMTNRLTILTKCGRVFRKPYITREENTCYADN